MTLPATDEKAAFLSSLSDKQTTIVYGGSGCKQLIKLCIGADVDAFIEHHFYIGAHRWIYGMGKWQLAICFLNRTTCITHRTLTDHPYSIFLPG